MASSTIYHRDVQQKKNDRLVSVHTSATYGDISEIISASSSSGKEIAGLLKKKKKNGQMKACMNQLGLCMARNRPEKCCW